MSLERIAEAHADVLKADQAARAAREARDELIRSTVSTGEATRYRIAKTLGLTESALMKIVNGPNAPS